MTSPFSISKPALIGPPLLRLILLVCLSSCSLIQEDLGPDTRENYFFKLVGGPWNDSGSDILLIPSGGYMSCGSSASLHPTALQDDGSKHFGYVYHTDSKGDRIGSQVSGPEHSSIHRIIAQKGTDRYYTIGQSGQNPPRLLFQELDQEGRLLDMQVDFGELGAQQSGSDLLATEDGVLLLGSTDEVDPYKSKAGFIGPDESDIYLIKRSSAGEVIYEQKLGYTGNDYGVRILDWQGQGYLIFGYGQFPDQNNQRAQYDLIAILTDTWGRTLRAWHFGREKQDLLKDVLQIGDEYYLLAEEKDELDDRETRPLLWKFQVLAEEPVAIDLAMNQSSRKLAAVSSICQGWGGGMVITGTAYDSTGLQTDQFLTHISEEGNERWWRTFGGAGDDWAGTVIPAPVDQGYIFVGTQTFGDGLSTMMSLIKTDGEGLLDPMR